jgi:hypothetical protein
MLPLLTPELRCCVPLDEGKGEITQVTRLLRWLVAAANGKADTHDNRCRGDSERAYQPTPQHQDHNLEVTQHTYCRT